MKINELVFSNRFLPRFTRHLLFWLSRIFFYYLWGLGGALNGEDFHLPTITAIKLLILNAAFDIGYCYIIVYMLLPLFFFRKRYTLLVLFLVVLTLFVFVLKMIFGSADMPPLSAEEIWLGIISFINSGPVATVFLFASFKMLKMWHLKEKQKLSLIKGNNDSELKLLKAQLHPHFLFNTLNNIYAYTLRGSELAPELVKNLLAILRYITEESKANLTPVVKEVNILKDYIGIEQVRYGNNLALELSIKGDYENKNMAPLLMIPFIENAFKHGASKILLSPWIAIVIIVNDNNLSLSVRNNKPVSQQPANPISGIGLKNVRRRLDILYPQQHNLRIDSNEELFAVDMVVPIENNNLV
jgi:sensor histidine kinase YesM